MSDLSQEKRERERLEIGREGGFNFRPYLRRRCPRGKIGSMVVFTSESSVSGPNIMQKCRHFAKKINPRSATICCSGMNCTN